MSNIIPFGKHKGKPVDALLDDRDYLDWLLAQSWFQQRYASLYQIVINNGVEPTETPEHNAFQIKFLDDAFRLKFAYKIDGTKLIDYADRNCEIRIFKADFETESGADVSYMIEIGNHSYWPPTFRYTIEIKPTVSDDYPHILRQCKRNLSKYLFIGSYIGVGANQNQFIEYFKTQGITVVFESEIDSIDIPSILHEKVYYAEIPYRN